MSVADFILTGIIAFVNFGVNLLPENISTFTISDLTTLLATINNFWVQSFGLTSHFFPYALFFTFLILIVFMETSLLVFKAVKYVINIIRGAGG